MKGLLLPQARAIFGGLIGLGFALMAWSGVMDGLEDLTVDYRLRFRPRQGVSDEVRLVGIGDRDVASTLGRWPFPRAIHADVLSILHAMGARHAVFDILFTEPSADPDQDARLTASFKKHPNLTLAYHFEDAGVQPSASQKEDRDHFIEEASRFGVDLGATNLVAGQLPVAPFAEIPAQFGAVNVVPDPDGIIRRIPLFFSHRGRLYPSLAMQAIIDVLEVQPDQISIEPGHQVTIVDTERGTLRIPIDAHGQYRINFTGDLDVFTPAFEYLDLYGAVESAALGSSVKSAINDRVVLIGLVSTGNSDMVNASIGRMPGVAVQAMVMSNILSGNHLSFPSPWLQFVILVAGGAALGLCMWPVRPWLGITVFVIFVAAWCGGAMIAAASNLILPVVPVLSTFGVAALGMLGLEATAIKQDRSRVLGVLGRYISGPILRRLVDTKSPSENQTERRELTIFFSDIRGFTSWTERAEPDEVAIRLNEYFCAMTPIIERHGGTLDKFIGDGIMVFMGAPDPMPDHAVQTVRMAIEMQEEMRAFNARWAQKGHDPLEIGIGIHTGFVTVGSFGSPQFLDYTVIGRSVNLASRIESETKGGQILISNQTHSIVRGVFQTRSHSELHLKGIPDPQVVFEVILPGESHSPAIS